MSPQSQEPHDIESNFTSSSSSSNDNIMAMACSPPPPTGSGNDNEGTATNNISSNDITNITTKETIPVPSSKGSGDNSDDGPTQQQQQPDPPQPPQPPQTTEQKTTTTHDNTRNNDGQPSQLPQTTEQNKTTIPSSANFATGTTNATAATGLISPLTIIKNKNEEISKGSGSILQKLKNKQPNHDHPNEPSIPTTPQVDSYAISKIGQARERIKRSFDKSTLLTKDEYVFPRFEMDELTLGKILGEGGFGTVLEITGMDIVMEDEQQPKNDDPEVIEEEISGSDEKSSSDGGEKDVSPSSSSAFTEKSTVFFVDELDNDKSNNTNNNNNNRRRSHRRKSHSFRFRRRGHHHHDHGTTGGSERNHIKSCNSHDGFEGLASDDGLRSVSDRGPVPMSQSDDVLTPLSHVNTGTTRSNSPTNSCEESSSEKHRHPSRLRSKSLTWTHAKAAAHDVSHFFHRSPKNHHGDPGTPHHREIEVALTDEKKDACGDDEKKKLNPAVEVDAEETKAIVANHREVLDSGRGLPSKHQQQQQQTKRVSYEDNSGDQHFPAKRRTRQVSRNFSFVSWRDSEAGEEGNDAISVEELKRYNIDSSLSRSVSVEVFLDRKASKEGGDDDDNDEGNDNCGISSSREQSDSKDPSTAATVPDRSDKKLTVQTKFVSTRGRRRVILKSTPHEVGTLPPDPEEETVVAVTDQRPSAYYGSHQAELVTTTLSNAAHYGGHQAKELVATTLHTAAYYGGVQQQQDKTFITEHATTKSGQARYAIKIISPHIVENDFKKYLQAAMDMATETYFLSVLNHPNILKLRAVGQGDMFSPSYFLVFDRLYDTLSDRIEGAWGTKLDHLENSILVWGRAKKLRLLWVERMSAMKDLAGALHHLHTLKIIYRDIKPENVGFDSRGTVKLFDFGLAKECHEEDMCANGTYKLTPNTGSIRYMAPENGNKWPYNFYADSYSFGIMLWEVASLERPFASYTPRETRDMVMKWGERPKVKEGWSEPVVMLMKQCWDAKFRNRPSMEAIKETLEKEVSIH